MPIVAASSAKFAVNRYHLALMSGSVQRISRVLGQAPARLVALWRSAVICDYRVFTPGGRESAPSDMHLIVKSAPRAFFEDSRPEAHAAGRVGV